jgi:HK97 family phage major capsid protein
MVRNFNRNHLAIAIILGVAALAFFGAIPQESVAGLGALPFMMGDISELKSAFDDHNRATVARIKAVEGDMRKLEDAILKSQRMELGGGGGILAGGNAQESKAFFGWMRSGELEPEMKSMRVSDDPSGGYVALPSAIDTEVTKYLRNVSAMRKVAAVVSVEAGEYKQIHSTLGTGSSWVGETQARPETTSPSIKVIAVPVCEQYANPAITQTLLDDAMFDVGAWLVEEVGDQFADAEGDAFINGDGISKPRGLFTYATAATADATRAHDTFQHVTTGVAGDFPATANNPTDKLIDLIYSVKSRYRQNAVFLTSPEVLSKIRKFKDSQGNYIWQPAMTEGAPSRILGYPVYEDENVPALAANSLSMAFGDFRRAYVIVDRKTLVLRDPFTNKPYVLFYTTRRVGGGGGRDTRAVKFMKFA